jgi:hypothetical protein
VHQGEAHRLWPYSIAAIVSRAKRARTVLCRFRASVLAELAPCFRAFLLPLESGELRNGLDRVLLPRSCPQDPESLLPAISMRAYLQLTLGLIEETGQ